MPNEKNLVEFGLENVHVAILEADEVSGEMVHGTPKPWPGAVTLTYDPSSTETRHYADNRLYYFNENNNGYTGAFTTTLVPNWLYTSVFGETVDSKGKRVERTTDKVKEVALLFEIDGDAEASRLVFYRVRFARPSKTNNTITETAEPGTTQLNITILPRVEDKATKAVANPDSPGYDGWYDAVELPDFETPGA